MGATVTGPRVETDRLTFISMANMECPIKPTLRVFDWRRGSSAKGKIHFSMLLIWNPERRRVHRRVSLGGSCHFTLPRFERRLQPFTHNCPSDCLKSTISITVHPCDRLKNRRGADCAKLFDDSTQSSCHWEKESARGIESESGNGVGHASRWTAVRAAS